MWVLCFIWTEFVVLEIGTLKTKLKLSLSVTFLEAACLCCYWIKPGWRAETAPGGHCAAAWHLIRVALWLWGSLKPATSTFGLRVQEDQITGVTLSSWSPSSKHSLCTRSPVTMFALLSVLWQLFLAAPCGLRLTSSQPRDTLALGWQPGRVELWR